MTDLKKTNYSVLRRLKKSQTQQHLHRKRNQFKLKQNKLPDLEARNNGGIYAEHFKKKRKPDPLNAEIGYLTSGYIHNHGSIDKPTYKTPRSNVMLQGPDQDQFMAVRKQFIERGIRNKLNPITHQEDNVEEIVKRKYQKRNDEIESLMLAMQKPRIKDDFEVSSEESEKPVVKAVKRANSREKDILYHDGEPSAAHRYISESKSMGLDNKPNGAPNSKIANLNSNQPVVSKQHGPLTARPQLKRQVINKTFKGKNSVMSVFPSYGILTKPASGPGKLSPMSTMNQFYASRKTKEEEDEVDKTHFRRVYGMKTYMEEMLKAKNMRGEKK